MLHVYTVQFSPKLFFPAPVQHLFPRFVHQPMKEI